MKVRVASLRPKTSKKLSEEIKKFDLYVHPRTGLEIQSEYNIE
jgi:hypothetical protein